MVQRSAAAPSGPAAGVRRALLFCLVGCALLIPPSQAAAAEPGEVLKDVLGRDAWHLEMPAADIIHMWRIGGDTVHDALKARNVKVEVDDGVGGVAQLGFRVTPAFKDFEAWPPKIPLKREVFIVLREPVPDGARVAVALRMRGRAAIAGGTWSATAVSPFLKVNQVGFLPEDQDKAAFVGAYLGTLGPRPLPAGPFEIIDDESGVVVHRGESNPAPRAADDYGERLLVLRFHALRIPGRYRVQVPGVGRSPAFRIGEDIYEAPLRTVQRAFYHHRSGVELRAPYTDHPRAAGHPAAREGCIHEGLKKTPLYGREKKGTCIGATGGWYDASDYGKYIPTAAPAVYELLRAAAAAPDILKDGSANIPESANGIPDLIDEVMWELDWILSMQRADGGVYHKLTGPKWADGKLPVEDLQTRYLADVTTHDTGRAGALLALGARHAAPWDADRAARYAAAARKAWAFLKTHRRPVPKEGFKNRKWTGGGEYSDRFGDADERAWLAVELYALTGEKEFHDAFLASLPKKRNPKTPPLLVRDWPPPFEDSWRFALWSYATMPKERAVDMAVVKDIGTAWRWRATSLTVASLAEPYGLSFEPPRGEGSFGYGHANGLRYAKDLLLACHLLGPRERWRQAALRNLGVTFGANGPGLSFITGVGERVAEGVEYRIDRLDGVDAPTPGHPVDGPSSSVHWTSRAFEEDLLPREEFPPMQRYFDFPDPIMNEPTIDEMGAAFVPLALLASPKMRARLRDAR